jgi:hypothetical protein
MIITSAGRSTLTPTKKRPLRPRLCTGSTRPPPSDPAAGSSIRYEILAVIGLRRP